VLITAKTPLVLFIIHIVLAPLATKLATPEDPLRWSDLVAAVERD
jgi:hypothetical protein